MSKPSHIPVLVQEVVTLLDPKPNNILVDATVGLGGHAIKLLERLGAQGRLIGIDQDEQALQSAREYLKQYQDRLVLVRGNFRNLIQLVPSDIGSQGVDGILIDLGVSSLQLDEPTRGFSFLHNAPLDMRMDAGGSDLTAADIVNQANFTELVRILQEFGEEPKAESIAKRILEFRKRRPITTTFDLVEVVGGRPGKIHPATRVFQALRIATNQELQALSEVLPQAIELLRSGGKLAVISFHSLEDRIVKNFFKNQATGGRIKLLSKKAIAPSWEERKRNSRSRSAKLRIVEKI